MKKYKRHHDEPGETYECTKCKWTGTDDEKIEKEIEPYWMDLVCPKCENPEFYMLTEGWVKKRVIN